MFAYLIRELVLGFPNSVLPVPLKPTCSPNPQSTAGSTLCQ
jgi:hypothetical protein